MPRIVSNEAPISRPRPAACDRVAVLLLESAGGKLDGGAIDVVARQVDLAPVALHLSEVHRILGEKLETNEIFRILQQLGFELMPERGGDPDFTVHIPSWRLDVEREIDLVEEIARLHGYDKFANTLPAYAGAVVEAPDAEKDNKLRTSLLALGYDEAVSLTFISHEDAETFSAVPGGRTGQSSERRSVGDAEFAGARHAQHAGLQPQPRRGQCAPVRGRQHFRGKDGGTAEPKRICMGATFPPSAKTRKDGARPDGGFFDLKGDVENLLQAFQHKALTYDAKTSDYYHPGRSARALMDGAAVAQFGQIHPEIAAAAQIASETFWSPKFISTGFIRSGLRVSPLPTLARYPCGGARFFICFRRRGDIRKDSAPSAELGLAELRSFVPAEIFRGGKVPAGKYSLLLRARFQSLDADTAGR